MAAWQALVDRAHVQPGQRVLVHAGAGGLGSTVIQVAKHLGAHIATTASTKDIDRVKGFGADVVVDYSRQDFSDVLSGYDVVLDSLGGDNLKKSLTVLKPGGLAISVVGPPDPDAIAFMRALGLDRVDILGFSLGGFVAQTIAVKEPVLVRRMILAGTGPAGFKGVGQANRRLLGDSLHALARWRDPRPLLFFTRTPDGRDAARAYMARIGERTDDRVQRTSLRAAAAQLRAIMRWGSQHPTDLGAIPQPVLVANGEDDRMLATRGSFDLAHRLPSAELVIYPDAGHGGIFQHHDDFVLKVLGFLGRR